ncbi:hypothetical protein MNBD_GAMMA12-3445 [hydrothermal vent metagenome]|uniref:Anti sigma-E protein RseA N-terminal domain-containing protein n=1 Tax=hydrothermal vent metagenome TaxID=652676 RepID=A0A3B0Z0I9_9ZZZZ
MNNATVDKVKEQISAMLDGELSVQEQGLLLRQIARDKSLQQTFKRYQLIHDSMSNQLPSQLDLGFADRMHHLIENEETSQPVVAETQSLSHRFFKPLIGIAVAATVAIVVLFSSNIQLQPDNDNDGDLIAGVSDADKDFRVNPMRWNTSVAAVRVNLNSLLVNHSEYTSSTNIQGMMQYVRIAGYDVEQDKQTSDKENK